MIPVNVAAPFDAIPAWFKHAPADGLTLADFVVPGFLFSLGLSAALSYRSRTRTRGFARTLLHTLVRSVLLFAFGSVGILLVDTSARWEILQMLAATGLLSFFFLPIPPWPRLAAAAALLATVEVLRPLGLGRLMQSWYDTGIAGPWGTASLAFFAVSASAIGELAADRPPADRAGIAAAFAAALAGSGLLALPLHAFSKHLLSLSYILFTAGVCCGLLAVLVLAIEVAGMKPLLLDRMGRNALLLYMLHAVAGVGALALLGPGAPVLEAGAASALVLALCAGVAVALDRHRVYLKL